MSRIWKDVPTTESVMFFKCDGCGTEAMANDPGVLPMSWIHVRGGYDTNEDAYLINYHVCSPPCLVPLEKHIASVVDAVVQS